MSRTNNNSLLYSLNEISIAFYNWIVYDINWYQLVTSIIIPLLQKLTFITITIYVFYKYIYKTILFPPNGPELHINALKILHSCNRPPQRIYDTEEEDTDIKKKTKKVLPRLVHDDETKAEQILLQCIEQYNYIPAILSLAALYTYRQSTFITTNKPLRNQKCQQAIDLLNKKIVSLLCNNNNNENKNDKMNILDDNVNNNNNNILICANNIIIDAKAIMNDEIMMIQTLLREDEYLSIHYAKEECIKYKQQQQNQKQRKQLTKTIYTSNTNNKKKDSNETNNNNHNNTDNKKEKQIFVSVNSNTSTKKDK